MASKKTTKKTATKKASTKKKTTRKTAAKKTTTKRTATKKAVAKKASAKPADSTEILDVAVQIARLETMSLGGLQERYHEVIGEFTRSRNKGYLRKKIADHIQRLAEKKAPKAKSASPMPQEEKPKAKKAATPKTRDYRLPAPGTVITRKYKGVTHEVKVLEKGVEYKGKYFTSMSKLARELTGTSWNGYLFFGLIKRSGGAQNEASQ